MSRMKKIASSALNVLIQATKISAVTFLTLNYVGGFVVCYGPSMEPTLRTNDVLLTEHISPRFQLFDVGDVVVARSPGDNRCICKRVVACPGDSVLYKNETITVPEQCVWLEGDNKGNSNDSRYYGPVPYSLIRRRCFCKVWPQFDLNLEATDRFYLYSAPERQQKLIHNHHRNHHKEDAEKEQEQFVGKGNKQQSEDSLEEAHCAGTAGRGVSNLSNNNGSLRSDNVNNDERDKLLPMMKTSDSREAELARPDTTSEPHPLVSYTVSEVEKDNKKQSNKTGGGDDRSCTSLTFSIDDDDGGGERFSL